MKHKAYLIIAPVQDVEDSVIFSDYDELSLRMSHEVHDSLGSPAEIHISIKPNVPKED